MGAGLEDVLRSFSSLAFCFFVGESFRLNVNVRLLGRSRLDELADLSARASSSSSPTGEACRDLIDFCVADLVFSPIDEGVDVGRDTWGVSSLCMRTKSALTWSFRVRI